MYLKVWWIFFSFLHTFQTLLYSFQNELLLNHGLGFRCDNRSAGTCLRELCCAKWSTERRLRDRLSADNVFTRFDGTGSDSCLLLLNQKKAFPSLGMLFFCKKFLHCSRWKGILLLTFRSVGKPTKWGASSMVEQLPFKQLVRSSNLRRPTTSKKPVNYLFKEFTGFFFDFGETFFRLIGLQR